jgi:hypothetical protein
VNAQSRAIQALRLRKLGFQYEEIAQQCGYKGGKGEAWNAVQKLLAKEKHEEVEGYRKLETARLDDLMRPFMLRAMKGEKDAALVVLRIMERRAKLLGIDITPQEEGDRGIIREYIGLDLSQVVSSNGHATLALPDTRGSN